MSAWINLILDCVLIGLVAAGLVQSMRLIHQLQGLRQGRNDMERFVREFNATVLRAEAGIKGLRQAARDSGDDLEKLIEKSTLLRDELQFIVESADQIASRLSQNASLAMRPAEKPAAKPAETVKTAAPAASPESVMSFKKSDTPASRAEKELMQALEKLG
jgi:hypothetical protein